MWRGNVIATVSVVLDIHYFFFFFFFQGGMEEILTQTHVSLWLHLVSESSNSVWLKVRKQPQASICVWMSALLGYNIFIASLHKLLSTWRPKGGLREGQRHATVHAHAWNKDERIEFHKHETYKPHTGPFRCVVPTSLVWAVGFWTWMQQTLSDKNMKLQRTSTSWVFRGNKSIDW